MAESMKGLKRSCYCGEPRESDAGKEITVCGWVQRQRDLGQLIFVDLRDRSGLVQLAFDETTAREVFEKMAVFTTLVNNEIYYAQFRLDLDGDEFYISCRSCNLVEDVLPGENELFYLFAMPHSYMEDYGDGIVAVLSGGDPYEAFETCQAAVDAQ